MTNGNTNEGLTDFLAGSVDESVARQFDKKKGGGFVDETLAVTDPTRSASRQTEQDIRMFGPAFGPIGTQATVGAIASDASDELRGERSPPPGSVQDTADRVFGQTDESVNRQFDAQPGGGAVDVTVKKFNKSVAKPAMNIGPDWLDEAAKGLLILVGLGLLVQLFAPAIEGGIGE